MKRKGFTLVELLTVITLLGIMAVVAVPKFISFREEAQWAAEQATVGAIRSGIHTFFAGSIENSEDPFYPPTLDDSNDAKASSANPLFGTVLGQPVTRGGWRRISDTIYQGPSDLLYSYGPITGVFIDFELLDEVVLDALAMTLRDIDGDFINEVKNDNKVDVTDCLSVLGGSLVVDNCDGGEPEVIGSMTETEIFEFTDGTAQFEITDAHGGYYNGENIEFGYYTLDVNGNPVKTPIFNGSDRIDTNNTEAFPAGTTVGFYLSVLHLDHTFYSETDLNETGGNGEPVQHMQVYHNQYLGKYVIGCEDLMNGGDQDFQDYIVTIDY